MEMEMAGSLEESRATLAEKLSFSGSAGVNHWNNPLAQFVKEGTSLFHTSEQRTKRASWAIRSNPHVHRQPFGLGYPKTATLNMHTTAEHKTSNGRNTLQYVPGKIRGKKGTTFATEKTEKQLVNVCFIVAVFI